MGMRELGSSTLKSGSFFVSSKAISALITLAILVFLARFLKPADFGLYSIVYALYALLGMGGNFGMGTALRKKLAERNTELSRKRNIIGNGFFIAGAVSGIIALIGIAISGVLANSVYHSPALLYPIIVASISVFLTVLFNLSVAVLVGLRASKHSSLANIVYSISQLVLVLGLVLLGYGIFGAMLGLALSLAIGFVYAFAMIIRRLEYRISGPIKSVIKELTGFSIPVVTSNIAISGTMSLAILLLGVFTTASIVGSYSAAYRLGRFFELIMTSMTFVLLPAFSYALSSTELSKKLGSAYSNSIYYSFLVIMPLLAFGIAAAKPITRLLFGSLYSGAPLYFAIIAAGTSVSIIGNFAATLIIGNGDTKRFMRYQLAVVIVELALMLALIPFIKVTGALLSLFIISPIVLDALYLHALKKQFSIKVAWGRICRLVAASAMLGAILFAINIALNFRLLSILASAVAALILFPPMLVSFRAISRNEIGFLKETADRIRIIKRPVLALLKYFSVFL